MAGIGFELKKLFARKGIMARLRAYGYTGVVTTGPMLLGVCFLLGITWIGSAFGMQKFNRELLVSMITYALLISLTFTSWFSMVNTRYLSDQLFVGNEKNILPSLSGMLALLLPAGGTAYFIFLLFSGIPFLQVILNFLLFTELLVVWTEINYLTAIKDYKGIVLTYLLAIAVSFASALLGCALFGANLTILLGSLCIGYGVMLGFMMRLLYRFFPEGERNSFEFLLWMDEYRPLAYISLFTNIGLFSHLVIAWFSSIGKHMRGLFYAAPEHDVAALFAFLTILITTINFVASVEVNFYPKYRTFYDLFNGRGSIPEIETAEKEMLEVLTEELNHLVKRQFFTTAIMISVGVMILDILPLGFDSLMNGYFRILSVGYGLYSVGNVLVLMLLYFTDYKDAAVSAILFGSVTTVGCLISLSFDAKFYGFAFSIGAAVYYLTAWLRLRQFVNDLPFHILSTQPIVAESKHAFFSKAADRLESFGRNKKGKMK